MKTIIVGGAATGMGVAAKLKRNDPNNEIVVYQNHDYVSLGACGLPYYVANNFEDKNNLIARSVDKFEENGIKIVTNSLVTKIDFKTKTINYLLNNEEHKDTYDELVISVGARPMVLPFKGADSKNVFTLTSLEDGVALKGELLSNSSIKNVAVIGGGFIGIELCESLSYLNKNVTLIEMASKVSSRVYDSEVSELIENELVKNGVNLVLNTQVYEFITKDDRIISIKTVDGKTIEVDAVIMSIGFTPNTGFLKDSGLDLNNKNAIIVNELGQTNIPNVWSGGDCAVSKNYINRKDVYSPLATVASKFAKVIADNISGKKSKFVGSLQTSIIRAFDIEVARTGFTETECIEMNIDYKSVVINDKDHTNYVSGQSDLMLKLIMDNKTRQIIGAQMVGKNKSVLRIYSLITMIWSKVKVDEILEQIDLPYAPPFSRTVDIIHIALSKLNKK